VADCTFELAEMIPRGDGRYAEFFNVSGADPHRIRDLAARHEESEVTLLEAYEDGGLFEFVVSGNCPAHRLAELGALPRIVESERGEGRIVVEIPRHRDPAAVVGEFVEGRPNAELTRKEHKSTVGPLVTESAVEEIVRTRLTDRQTEVLKAAFEMGYYEWPRECDGTDVASALDISSATFSEHIHAAERKLLTMLFGGVE
jgi:hypothetical protein